MGSPTYSLKGNGTDLSKLYPSGDTNIGYSAVTTTIHANYIHVEPNSHFWTDLQQLIDSIEFGWLDERIGKEFILIGLHNTIKNGYKLKPIVGKYKLVINPCFDSIEQMIEYVENEAYSEGAFYIVLKETLKEGLNLTNGLKMERTEVYKRIDTERDYQYLRWTPRRQTNGTPDEQKPPAEWINYIEYHIAKAKDEVYMLNDEEALAHVRKVAALAVRCLELHGCPERVIPEELLKE